jgi:hypothetical protein
VLAVNAGVGEASEVLVVTDARRPPYATDILACTGCGGLLRLMSAITNRSTAQRILEQLGLPRGRSRPWPRRPGAPAVE